MRYGGRHGRQMTRWSGRIAAFVLAGCFSAFFTCFAAEPDFLDDAEAFSRLYFGLQPPSDRDAERTVELVEELLDAGRFGEAAPLADRLFDAQGDLAANDGEGLRSRLIDALRAAPPAGVRVVRSVLGAELDRRLGESTNPAELRSLVARFPPEVFGVDALVVLALAEADSGAPSAAAAALRRARLLDEAAGEATPAWRLFHEAANWRRAGRDDGCRCGAASRRRCPRWRRGRPGSCRSRRARGGASGRSRSAAGPGPLRARRAAS